MIKLASVINHDTSIVEEAKLPPPVGVGERVSERARGSEWVSE